MRENKSVFYIAVFFSLLVSIACLQPFVFELSQIGLNNFFSPEYKAHKFDFIQNIILFIPVAFLWNSYFLNYKKTIVICLLLSLGLECLQLMIPSRVASVFDFIANLIGIVLGTFSSNYFNLLFLEQSPKQKNTLTLALQFYLLVFLIYSFYPFDLSFHPVEIYRSFKNGKLVLIPFSDFNVDSGDYDFFIKKIFLYIPIGILSLSLSSKETFKFSRLKIALVILFGIEFAQIFALNRFSSTTDLVCGLLGILFGAVFYISCFQRIDRFENVGTKG